jgi:preprotein translocase subunit SecB
MNEPRLYLENYYITDIDIKLNKGFKKPEGLIDVNPKFSKKLDRIDENRFVVRMKVTIEEKVNKPFYGSLTIQGNFKCENFETTEDGQYLTETTTLVILFPYLRQALSTVTTLLNIPTYVLPVVNVEKIFK